MTHDLRPHLHRRPYLHVHVLPRLRVHPRSAVGLVLVGVAALGAAGTAQAAGTPGTDSTIAAAPAPGAAVVDPPPERPNIVLFMTDDQNRDDLPAMLKTTSLLGGHGVTFENALSPAPSCCPARAMTVTGQYGQNNGVQNNSGAHGGYQALVGKQNTLAAWLHAAGYQTAMAGKYLHGYHRDNAPPQVGWTHWWPSVDNIYTYLATVFLEDGKPVATDRNVTPLLTDFTDSFVHEFAQHEEPFFLWINHLAPHVSSRARGDTEADPWGPPKPTSKYSNVLGDVVAPSFAKPSFDRVARPHPYTATLEKRPKPRMQGLYTGRIRTLQDVDDAVQRLVDVLQETGELASTYIFFVSDNGVLLGEHKRSGKNVLYREALEIPMVVRVPGATQGTVSGTPVTIADLAPTIAELAGVEPGRPMDGQSFVPLLRGQSMEWRDTQLIQTGSERDVGREPGWGTRGVRTTRYTYIRRSGDRAEFLYDRRRDPYELVSVADLPAYADVLTELRHRRRELVGCEGATCSRTFGPLPRVRR